MSKRVSVEVRLEDGSEVVGWVELFTTPATFEELEHDVEVTANLDGIWLPDGRNVHVGRGYPVVRFDLVREG